MVLGFRYSHGRHRGSVLPKIRLEKAPQGVRVFAEVTTWKDAAGFWALTAFVIAVIVFALWIGPTPSRKIGGVISMLAASGVLVEMGRRYFRQRRLHSATLVVRPWPLRLGQRATAVFDKRLKHRAKVDSITAKLTCTEEATRSSGRDQKVLRATRYEFPLDTSRAKIEPGHVRDEWEIEIPSNGIPSFAAKSNRIQWRVETTTETDGAGVTADFELLVIPEVVS